MRTSFASILALPRRAVATCANSLEGEQESLQASLAKPATVPIEFVRAIENHLKQYPNSPRRAELERALVKTAIDLNDDRRMIEFGESVSRASRTTCSCWSTWRPPSCTRRPSATPNARWSTRVICENLIQATYKNDKFEPGGGREVVKRKEDFDRGRARALLLQARAQGCSATTEEAIQLASPAIPFSPASKPREKRRAGSPPPARTQRRSRYWRKRSPSRGLHSADLGWRNDRDPHEPSCIASCMARKPASAI